MEASGPITLTQEVSVAPLRLWQVLTQPALWWGPEVTLDAQPGGAFREPWRDRSGAEHLTLGRVTEARAPERLVILWRDEDWAFETEVRITIEARDGGSLLRLSHAGWQSAPEDQRPRLWSDHQAGWRAHLARLAEVAGR